MARPTEQVLIFITGPGCKVIHSLRLPGGNAVVWITRERAKKLADHILEHLDEFPEVLP